MLTKEMDLHKFILRQRISAMSALATLSSRQSFVIDKMSQMVIRESTDGNSETEPDDELN